MSIQLEALNDFCARICRSRDWVYKKAKNDPTFPKLIHIGGRTFIDTSDANTWLNNQIGVSKPSRSEHLAKMTKLSVEARARSKSSSA